MNFTHSVRALPRGAVSFVREARQELKTVQWPARRETVRATLVILVVSAVVAAVTGAFDVGLVYAVEKILLR